MTDRTTFGVQTTRITPAHWVMLMKEEQREEDEVIDLGAPISGDGLDFTFEVRMSTEMAERIAQHYNERLETELRKTGQDPIQPLNVGQALTAIIQQALIASK